MIYEKKIHVLELLKEKTRSGSIRWVEDDTDSYFALAGDNRMHIDFLYLEVLDRGGADRLLVHVYFPGFNSYFHSGTEGYSLVVEILACGFDRWREHITDYGDDALAFLGSL